MARFNSSGSFAGKGQKDLGLRVKSLAENYGVVIEARNPHHPHLFSRSAVAAAERGLGIMWGGITKTHVPAK